MIVTKVERIIEMMHWLNPKHRNNGQSAAKLRIEERLTSMSPKVVGTVVANQFG